jgi:Holliday junction resolvase
MTDKAKQGRSNKAKGRTGENEVVEILASHGIKSERMPLSGSLGGKYKSDVKLSMGNKRIEVKRRKTGLKTVYGWLDEQTDANYLFFRPDGDKSKWLVIMPVKEFAGLIKKGSKK